MMLEASWYVNDRSEIWRQRQITTKRYKKTIVVTQSYSEKRLIRPESISFIGQIDST